MVIRKRAFPRVALIGNPSDAYFGKIVTMTFDNFSAETILYETPELEIKPGKQDTLRYGSLRELINHIERFGYDGGVKLIKATIKVFYEYCRKSGVELKDTNFTILFETTIPFQVGMGGSSAIITSCIHALETLFEIEIPKPTLANLILSVERDELGIPAGLQDRVAQVYEGLIFMDFNKSVLEKQEYGVYEELDPALLPPLYIAFRKDYSENTHVLHFDLRKKFREKDPDVLAAIEEWITQTDNFRAAFLDGRTKELGDYINQNFDIRQKVCPIDRENIRMIEMARSVGASAKFTGSGGAIIGTYTDEHMYDKLRHNFSALNIEIFKPNIAATSSFSG